MPVTLAFCSSAKAELLRAVHDFTASTGDTFNMGLFRASSVRSYGAATTNLSTVTAATSDEASVTNGTGYTTGGIALTNVTPSVDGTAGITDFSVDPVWTLTETTPTVSLSSDGAFIYNATASNAMISVHPFAGAPVTATGNGATFTVVLPAAASATAVLRLA